MRKIIYDIDPSFVPPWVERIGKAILNFSVIEFESYQWLVQLTEQPEFIEKFTKDNFTKRVSWITKLVLERGFEKEWKIETNNLWARTLVMSQTRNRIAHNPLTYGWTIEPPTGEPDFIDIINMKKNNSFSIEQRLSKNDLDDFINQAVDIVKRLTILREHWCNLRDAQYDK